MPCKGSRLTTDLESDYSNKGSIRGDVTISGVSVVRSKLQWLLLITETHLSISALFHSLREEKGWGWGLFNSVWKSLFLVMSLPLKRLINNFQH